jgi:hypothetical protein
VGRRTWRRPPDIAGALAIGRRTTALKALVRVDAPVLQHFLDDYESELNSL